jgi:hypothetical protein
MTEVSGDLKAIRLKKAIAESAQLLWSRLYADRDIFGAELGCLADAASNWPGISAAERFRALRILVRRFGSEGTYMLSLIAAPKSNQELRLELRKRTNREKLDGGKKERDRERDYWDYVIGTEVYGRMKDGMDKAAAIEAVKNDYRNGTSYESNSGLPVLNRPVRTLPAPEAIDKMLNRFRKAAKSRGYVDPFAGSIGFGIGEPREPDLKIADIPSRGRPSNK